MIDEFRSKICYEVNVNGLDYFSQLHIRERIFLFISHSFLSDTTGFDLLSIFSKSRNARYWQNV